MNTNTQICPRCQKLKFADLNGYPIDVNLYCACWGLHLTLRMSTADFIPSLFSELRYYVRSAVPQVFLDAFTDEELQP